MTKQDENRSGNISHETNKRIYARNLIHLISFPLKLLIYGVYLLFYVLIWSRLWGKMASKGNKGRSSRNQSSDVNGDDSVPQVIADIRRHHKQAYAFIDKALRIDESAGKIWLNEAISSKFYSKICIIFLSFTKYIQSKF